MIRTYPASYTMDNGGPFPVGKTATPFHLVSRLRMRGYIPPLPQCVFMAWYLVKHRDNFTLLNLLHSKLGRRRPPHIRKTGACVGDLHIGKDFGNYKIPDTPRGQDRGSETNHGRQNCDTAVLLFISSHSLLCCDALYGPRGASLALGGALT
jgi:hypothetical protein